MTSPLHKSAFLIAGLSVAGLVPANAQGLPKSPALANPLLLQPLEALSATRDRPLFSPSRRPPPPPAVEDTSAPPPAPMDPPDLVLIGTTIGAQTGAIVRASSSTDKPKIVHTGDDLGGWTVADVEPRTLQIRHDDRIMTYTLFSGGHSTMDETVVVPQRPPPILEVNANGVLTARRVHRAH